MEQFTIHNNYFDTLATNTFKNLLDDEYFTDVKLITADNKQIKSHKVILSTYSIFFKNVFLNSAETNLAIYLKDILYTELCWILNFIYIGQCKIEQTELDRFLSVGKDLEVQGIMEEDRGDIKDQSLNLIENMMENMKGETSSTEQKEEVKDPNHRGINHRDIPNVDRNEFGKYSCDQCEYQSTKQGNVKAHILALHEGVKYSCDQCEYQGTHQSDVKRHKLSVHEGVKYNCDQCDYQGSHVYRHKRVVHEGVKYYCDQCEFQGTQQSHVKRHELAVHEGVKYNYDQCEYQGTRPGSVKTHKLAVHDGVKYNCDQCEYQGTRQCSVRRHKLTVHKVI